MNQDLARCSIILLSSIDAMRLWGRAMTIDDDDADADEHTTINQQPHSYPTIIDSLLRCKR